METAIVAIAPTLVLLFGIFIIGFFNAYSLRGPLKPVSARLLNAHIGTTFLGLFMKFGPRPSHVVEVRYSYVVNHKTFIGHDRLYFVCKEPAEAYIDSHKRFSEIRAFYFVTHPQDSRLVSAVPRTAALITAAIAIFGVGFVAAVATSLDRKSDLEQTQDIIESVIPR